MSKNIKGANIDQIVQQIRRIHKIPHIESPPLSPPMLQYRRDQVCKSLLAIPPPKKPSFLFVFFRETNAHRDQISCLYRYPKLALPR